MRHPTIIFVVLLVTNLCLPSDSVGQLRFGFRVSAGIVNASPETDYAAKVNNRPADFKITFDKAEPQYGIGVFVQDEIGFLYFQSELMFTNYKTQFTVSSFNQTDDIIGQVDELLRYLDWQVMAGIFKNGYRVGVGPVVHIVADHESNFRDFALYNEKLRRLTYGFTFGIGYNLGLFSFDVKYERAFRDIGDHIWYDTFQSGFESRPDILSLAVGFGF